MIFDKIEIKPASGQLEVGITKREILQGEIEGLEIINYSVFGESCINETASPLFYDVILLLTGEALLEINGKQYELKLLSIAKIAYNEPYNIKIGKGKHFSCIRFRKFLNAEDCRIISQGLENHSLVYTKALSDCPTYTEDIKSSKTLNRMILPEGLVPRFCIGSVETEGPDQVSEHEHAMLDQLFFGLSGCKCMCHAEGEQVLLTENMLLHIPLGSKHSVSVEPGDTLAYIWLDFFLSHEGEKYMNEQHQMDDE